VPVEPAGAVFEHYAVAVRDGTIEAVLPAREAAPPRLEEVAETTTGL
jgi:hypothetical protein